MVASDFDRSVTHIDNSFVVPEIAGDPPLVAAWVKNPKKMLQALTDELHQILSLCDDGALKTRCITNSEGIPVRVFKELIFLQQREKCVSLVNAIQPTPFDSGVILRIRNELSRSSSLRFRKALKNYRTALRQLADWIETREILNRKSEDAGVKEPSTGIHLAGKQQRARRNGRTIVFNDPTTPIPKRFCVDGKPCGPFVGSITEIMLALGKAKTGRSSALKQMCDSAAPIIFVKESGINDNLFHAYFIEPRFKVVAKSHADLFDSSVKENHPRYFERR